MSVTIVIPVDTEAYKQRIIAHYKQAAKELVEIGRLLIEVRDTLKVDETFQAFCDGLPFRRKSAYNYIRLYEHVRVHGDEILALNQIQLSAWYVTPPEDEAAVCEIITQAKRGKKITAHDAKQIVAIMQHKDEESYETWNKVAEQSPQMVVEAAMTGTVLDLDGNDVLIEDADATMIRLTHAEYYDEKRLRQIMHIQENSKKTNKLTVPLELVIDKATGRTRVALPEQIPAWLIGKTVTFYIEDESEVPAA